MKITNFSPLLVTKDATDAIAVFEALGFKKRHTKSGINGHVESVVMKYESEDGKEFYMSIAEAPVPQDIPSIRMNIRDFEEAKKFLEDKGFTNTQGGKVTDTGSSVATMMVAPSGYTISISEHIKEHE